MSTTTTQNMKDANTEEKNKMLRKEDEAFVGLDIGFPEETVSVMDNSGSSKKGEYVCNVTKEKAPEQKEIINSDDNPDKHCDNLNEEPSQNKTDTADFIQKLPGLGDATSGTANKFEANQNDDFSSDSDNNEQELPTLLRKISMRSGRAKARLEDAPHLSKVIQRQLTRSGSSLITKTTSKQMLMEQRSDDEGNTSVRSQLPEENDNDSELSDDIDDSISEEDSDILEDDITPASKKRKRRRIKLSTYFQLFALMFLIAFLVCSYKIQILKDATLLDLHLWRWDSLALSIFCGRLLSDWFIELLVMLIKRQYMLKKRVLYFVYGLRQSVKNCIWLALVLSVWESIFEGLEGNLLVYILTKILFCIFTASVLWMLKILAVKVAASSFHRKVYFERMQECIFHQYLLEVLSLPPTTGDRQSPSIPSMQRSHRLSCNRALPIEQSKLQGLTSDNVSVWTVRSLMKVIRKAKISAGSSIISHPKKDGELDSEGQAKAAAKQIFYNMARPGQKSLTLEDFLHFLPEEQALRAFQLFEMNAAGEITKRALAKWVISVYNEHRALSLTLSDSRTVIAKLHKVLTAMLCAALVIVFLLIFGIQTSKLLLFFTSIFIPLVFIFGNSARTVFEALLFLFVVHPFDVGDRVVIDGQRMVVEDGKSTINSSGIYRAGH